MDLLAVKIGTLFLFFIGTLFSVLIPAYFGRTKNKAATSPKFNCQSVMALCNSFAGGIFLTTCFVGLLPLVRASFSKALQEKGISMEYNFGEISLLCGFFLIVFLEQIIVHKKQSSDSTDLKSDDEENHFLVDGSSHSHSHDSVITATKKSLVRTLALVVGLGTHTLFEGMAIGLQQNVDTLVSLVIAVFIHELACAVALGVNLSSQSISLRSSVIISVVFSLMLPTGLLAGIGFSEIQGFYGMIISAILQGLATGTFMYVLFLEILPATLSGRYVILQLMCMFIGSAFLVLIITLMQKGRDANISLGNVNVSLDVTTTTEYNMLNSTTISVTPL